MCPPGVDLYVKCEFFNPLASVKDRLAIAIIEDDEGVIYADLDRELRVDLALAWRTDDDSPALVRLLDVLAECAHELDPRPATVPGGPQ